MLAASPIEKEVFKYDKYILSYLKTSFKNKYIFLAKQYQQLCSTETTLYKDGDIKTEIDEYENKVYLTNLLRVLTNKEKSILILNYIAEYSILELANIYDVSRQSVNKSKIKALEKIRLNI